MGKVSKIGEGTRLPIKTKKERRRRLTLEEIDHFENKVKIHNRILLDPFGLTKKEWTKEEIKQQKRELDNKVTEKELKNLAIGFKPRTKKKSSLFCACRQHTIKDGYWVCAECGIKTRKAGTTK